jgi:ABC-type Fe3+-hydroxamate transport system substrate-binding protein
MSRPAAEEPRHHAPPPAILAAVVGSGGGMRRIFVDAIGTSVPFPASVRRLVATDDELGALVLSLGGTLVGCGGTLDGVESVGPARAPDPQRVAQLRPDLILSGVGEGAHDLLEERMVAALSRIAPIIAVDLGRRAAAEADLRALLGPAATRDGG